MGGRDLINLSSIDAHSVNKALGQCKPHEMIIYDLVVENQPCGRKYGPIARMS